MTTSQLPTRTATDATDEDAVPGEDTSALGKLFHERLQAWKHAVGYLEDYVHASEKLQHSQSKDYDKVLKTVSNPLKEGHHFDQQLGGIAGIFDNLRSNTQGIANSHTEIQKHLKGSVLPIFERLHAEIKNKQKELVKGAGKGGKAVEKSRNTTQKHIEFLGQHTASFDSAGGKINANEDPFVLHRQVRHNLHKQVLEENSNRQDLLSVQNSFAQFEAHIVKTIQTGLGEFNQAINTQLETSRTTYGNITMTAQAVKPDFEWKGFVSRNSELLIDPGAPQRDAGAINFPNEDHRSTKPLIQGALQRRSKLLRKYDTNFYAVSAAKFLHEFKSDNDFSKDPSPELSLYLPDCSVGAIDGTKFTVKGKDVSKGSVGNKLSMAHEIPFKADTPANASQWYEIIRTTAGQVTTDMPDSTAPNTPADAHAPVLPVGGTHDTTKEHGHHGLHGHHGHHDKQQTGVTGVAQPTHTTHDTTAGHSTHGTTAGQAYQSTTSAHPTQGTTGGQPGQAYQGVASGQPGQDYQSTAGNPTQGVTDSYPVQGSTAGQAYQSAADSYPTPSNTTRLPGSGDQGTTGGQPGQAYHSTTAGQTGTNPPGYGGHTDPGSTGYTDAGPPGQVAPGAGGSTFKGHAGTAIPENNPNQPGTSAAPPGGLVGGTSAAPAGSNVSPYVDPSAKSALP